MFIVVYQYLQYKKEFIVCNDFPNPKRSQKLELTYFSWSKSLISKYINKSSNNFTSWQTISVNQDFILGIDDSDKDHKIKLDRVNGIITREFLTSKGKYKDNYYNCRKIDKKIFEKRKF